MNVSIQQARRPYVRFDYSTDGQKVIAILMQHGDKFSETHKIADEWLAHITQEAVQGRYDANWVAQFKLEYDAFLKGNELPREGTPIRTWAAITREQGTRLLALRITTIEDLAAVPDSGLGAVGLDGRYLRDLARNVVEHGKGVGALEKRLADSEQLNRDQKEQIERMAERIAAIENSGKKKAA